jgi:tetratricopeptide (TPR) repeat protein
VGGNLLQIGRDVSIDVAHRPGGGAGEQALVHGIGPHVFALDEALKYEDQSIEVEKRYDNEMTKSNILEAMGRKDEADSTRKLVLSLANPLQLHIYARQLQAQKRPDEAFAIFRENARKHPQDLVCPFGIGSRLFQPGQVRRRCEGNEPGAGRSA